MRKTLYPEDIQAITGIARASGLLEGVRKSVLDTGDMGDYKVLLKVSSLLQYALQQIADLGNIPEFDFSDPDALRVLADQIEAEEQAEAEATRRTLHHLRTRNNLMGDEGPCELAHA